MRGIRVICVVGVIGVVAVMGVATVILTTGLGSIPPLGPRSHKRRVLDNRTRTELRGQRLQYESTVS